MSVLDDIGVDCTVALGSTTLPIRQVLKMSRGAMIPLDCSEEDPSLLYVNGQLFAEGQIIVDGDGMFLEITNVVKRRR